MGHLRVVGHVSPVERPAMSWLDTLDSAEVALTFWLLHYGYHLCTAQVLLMHKQRFREKEREREHATVIQSGCLKLTQWIGRLIQLLFALLLSLGTTCTHQIPLALYAVFTGLLGSFLDTGSCLRCFGVCSGVGRLCLRPAVCRIGSKQRHRLFDKLS